MMLGAILAYSSRCERRAAARHARPSPSGARTRGACSLTAPLGRVWSDFGPFNAPARHVLAFGRAPDAAAPSRGCHEGYVEPSSSVRDIV